MSHYTEYTAENQPSSKDLHPMVVLQPGEQVICQIKRHPFGLIGMYVGGVFAVALAAMLILLLPKVSTQLDTTQFNTFAYSGLAILVVMTLIVLGVATLIYWQNLWVVTTDSITQITQLGLFNRQVAQLSMDNLEDVTVDQRGLLPHMFNFGTLKVESAGERAKFMFPFCPQPNDCARKILDIHEKFLAERRDVQSLHSPTRTTAV